MSNIYKYAQSERSVNNDRLTNFISFSWSPDPEYNLQKNVMQNLAKGIYRNSQAIYCK